MALKLNANETKILEFNMAVRGTNYRMINSSMRIRIGKVEYAFPAKVDEKSLTVEIPPLEEFYKGDAASLSELKARLEVIAGDTYIIPWEGTFDVETPVSITTEIKSEKSEKIDDLKFEVSEPTEKKPLIQEKKPEPEPKPKKEFKPKGRFGSRLLGDK